MDAGFVTAKKQTTTSTWHHSRWQSFQFRFNSSAEIVCNQPNLSRIFSLRDNSAYPNISRIFSSHPYFFVLQIWGLLQRRRKTTVGRLSPDRSNDVWQNCTSVAGVHLCVYVLYSFLYVVYICLPLKSAENGHKQQRLCWIRKKGQWTNP